MSFLIFSYVDIRTIHSTLVCLLLTRLFFFVPSLAFEPALTRLDSCLTRGERKEVCSDDIGAAFKVITECR